MMFIESLECMWALWFVRRVQFFFLFKIVMVTNFRVWLFWNKFYWFKDYAKFSLNKLFTYHYAWKIICFLTGNLNNIWSLNNIRAHFITNPKTHYFFPCIMNSFLILFSEYPNVVQEFYSAILLFKLVVRISMGQCDVFVSEWCYILVVWNCEHERWEMTSYQPCEVKVCTTIFNFKFWM